MTAHFGGTLLSGLHNQGGVAEIGRSWTVDLVQTSRVRRPYHLLLKCGFRAVRTGSCPPSA